VSLPDFDQIVKAIQNDGELAEKIILALNVGMWEEWDCDLLRGMLVVGFGPAELMLAAQAIPNDIDWSDDKVRDATPVHDIENRYTVRVKVMMGTDPDKVYAELAERSQDLRKTLGG
jgi:uncharacterized Ntn-hydrolase superfamily protein